MKKESFFKRRGVSAIFAVVALVSGFLFLSKNITGNAVLNTRNSFNILPLIGLSLILCAVILTIYSLKKR